jgi:putative two-component system response regulator
VAGGIFFIAVTQSCSIFSKEFQSPEIAVRQFMRRLKPNPSLTNVLVVDDESAVREVVCLWLERLGYRCSRADSVASAMELLKNQSFDVVTSDIKMPGRSGIELLRLIVEEHPETPVLMLTANIDTQSAIQALTQGAYGYLLKPVKREEFVCQFTKALEHRQLLVENREYTTLLEWKVSEQTRAIRDAHEETIQRLVTASMYRDDETGGHIKRTGIGSALVAQILGWTPEQVELIQLAAPMHDVGKVGIPDAISKKPGKLSDEEYSIMKTHSVIGAKMLAGSMSSVLQMAEQIAHFHHERWDGAGYPDRLAGDEIPQAARILAIVDFYDALRHDRVYRKAVDEDIVLEMIEKGRETHFDPEIVQAFLEALPAIRAFNVGETDHELAPPTSYFPLVSELRNADVDAWAAIH